MYRPLISGFINLSLSLALLGSGDMAVHAQGVTEIITDYNGYWKSGITGINSVKPDNNNDLLSFTINNVRYSTGVNDALLTSHGEVFTAGDFRSMPLQNITGTVNSNTKIGLGAMADGVFNGTTAPAPSRTLAPYLSDGVNGLNIGTCVANMPAGTMFLSVSNLRPESIGDGVPDILVTQTADPSSTYDKYEFTDINGIRVGNSREIILNNITPVGNWNADFFEATGSTILQSGYTQTPRALRLWAADLSTFGIDESNIGNIAYFKIGLSGSSDFSFVAYNTKALSFHQILPVNFLSFTAVRESNTVSLEWSASADANYRFCIESSDDGVTFKTIDSVKTNALGSYHINTSKSAASANYYRIKHVDISGASKYSRILTVGSATKTTGAVFPNPATNLFTVIHPPSGGSEMITVTNMAGSRVVQKQVVQGATQTRVDISALAKGAYHVTVIDGDHPFSTLLIVR